MFLDLFSFFFFFYGLSFLAVEAQSQSERIPAPDHNLPTQSLKAAVLKSDIARRSLQAISLRHDLELDYIQGETRSTQRATNARVTLTSETPTLLLEEIEQMITTVECRRGIIEIAFASEEQLGHLKNALHNMTHYLIVTSHFGCNDHGSRLPFLVSNSPLSDVGHTLQLSAQLLTWKEAYHSINIGLNHKEHRDFHLNSHDHLRRRDSSALLARGTTTISPSVPVAPSSSTVTPASTVSFPYPDPSKPTSTGSAATTINFSMLGTQILPPNNTLVDDLGITLPAGLTLSCKNCTVVGDVELNDVSLQLSANPLVNGTASFTVNNMFAHVELETKWPVSSAGLNKTSFTKKLIEKGLPNLAIPDLAIIGPIFRLDLTLGAVVSADLDFTYGFEVTVPNNSSGIVNFGSLNQSTITGFQHSKFAALPFQAAVKDLTLTISAELQANLFLGVSFLNDGVFAGAGIFVNMPTISGTFQPVTGTDISCVNTTDTTLVQDISSLFGNLLHIQSELEIGAGFITQANETLIGHFGVERPFELAATSFAGPTACLAYNKGSSGYVAAKSALAAATSTSATASAAATSKAAGMVVAKNPLDLRHGNNDLPAVSVVLAAMLGLSILR